MKNLQESSSLPEYVLLICCFSLLFAWSGQAVASSNSCVDCHSNPKFVTTNKKLYTYYLRWENSVHAHAGVTCIDCHAGHPDKADKASAHGNSAKGADVALSAVYYSNIPNTCGKCHKEIVSNYKKSKHYEYLSKDNLLEMRGANCVTCHDMGMSAAEGNNLMTKAIASCKICHNYKTGNYPDIPKRIHVVLERYAAAKSLYSNLIIQHHDKIPEQVKNRLANSFLVIIDNLHALRLGKVEIDSNKLLVSMKDIRRKLRKGIAIDCN